MYVHSPASRCTVHAGAWTLDPRVPERSRQTPGHAAGGRSHAWRHTWPRTWEQLRAPYVSAIACHSTRLRLRPFLRRFPMCLPSAAGVMPIVAGGRGAARGRSSQPAGSL